MKCKRLLVVLIALMLIFSLISGTALAANKTAEKAAKTKPTLKLALESTEFESGSYCEVNLTASVPGFMTLTLEDTAGNTLFTLVENAEIHSKANSFGMYIKDDSGAPVPEGTYKLVAVMQSQYGVSSDTASKNITITPATVVEYDEPQVTAVTDPNAVANPYDPTGTAAYDPYNPTGTATYDPYAEAGATTYDPYNQTGSATSTYDPYNQAGTTTYDPYNQTGTATSTYDPYNQAGTTTYDPYNQTGSATSTYDPYNQAGTTTYDPYNQTGTATSTYDPYNQAGTTTYDPYNQTGTATYGQNTQAGTTTYDPYNQAGTTTYDPYNQTGTATYGQNTQAGTTTYDPYNQAGTTTYNPYNQTGAATYGQNTQAGTTTYDPYNQAGTTTYNPYNQTGAATYDPYNQAGATTYNPYNQTGVATYDPNAQAGVATQPATTQPAAVATPTNTVSYRSSGGSMSIGEEGYQIGVGVTDVFPQSDTTFWNLPTNPSDADLWAAIIHPITCVNVGEQESSTIYDSVGSGKAKLGTVSGVSQGVNVLVTRNDGWSLVEAFRNEDGAFIRGYIKTAKLKLSDVNPTYGIVVDKRTQTLTVYMNGQRIGSCLVCTGLPTAENLQRETPAGEFKIAIRRGTTDYLGKQKGSSRYTLRINNNVYLQEIPTTKRNGTDYSMLESYLGTKQTRGTICVQARASQDGGINAEWIWSVTDTNKKIKVLVLDDKTRDLIPIGSK